MNAVARPDPGSCPAQDRSVRFLALRMTHESVQRSDAQPGTCRRPRDGRGVAASLAEFEPRARRHRLSAGSLRHPCSPTCILAGLDRGIHAADDPPRIPQCSMSYSAEMNLEDPAAPEVQLRDRRGSLPTCWTITRIPKESPISWRTPYGETTAPPARSRTASPLRHRGSACAAVTASGLRAGRLTSWAILARLAGWMRSYPVRPIRRPRPPALVHRLPRGSTAFAPHHRPHPGRGDRHRAALRGPAP